jgi:hypothetical protein
MLKDTDFSKMEFFPLAKKAMCVEYPKLGSIVNPLLDKDCNKVKSKVDKTIRYILLMYDANSPLRLYYPDLEQRKIAAADLAGFDWGVEDMEEILEFKIKTEGGIVPNEEMLVMIMNYLKYQNNWVWTMIVSNSEAFYEYNKRVMMPVEGNRDKDILQAINIKTQIMQSQDDIYLRLQRYYKEMSGGDPMLEEEIKVRKRLRPEEIANVQGIR